MRNKCKRRMTAVAQRNASESRVQPTLTTPVRSMSLSGGGLMSILIRISVVGLLVLVAACGGEAGLEDVCGSCPEGPVFDGCVEAYNACSGVPTRTARSLCFDQLGSSCDNITE